MLRTPFIQVVGTWKLNCLVNISEMSIFIVSLSYFNHLLQVLNLFLALLLSSFSTDSLNRAQNQESQQAATPGSAGSPGQDSNNKLLEAFERIRCLCRYVSVHAMSRITRRPVEVYDDDRQIKNNHPTEAEFIDPMPQTLDDHMQEKVSKC